MLTPYSGSGSGFIRLGAFATLFRHPNFSDRMLYKKVNSLQEAVACGGVAIFDSTGSRMVIFAGEALQTFVKKGIACHFPYPTVTRKLGPLKQVYGTGRAVKSYITDVDTASWLDFTSEGTGWSFIGVITKMTSLIGVSKALDLPYPLEGGHTFTTFAEAYTAATWYRDYLSGARVQYGGALENGWSAKRCDILAGWMGVPWHTNMKAFISQSATEAIGDKEGKEFIQQAHNQLFAQYADWQPLLNMVFASVDSTMTFARNTVKAFACNPAAFFGSYGGCAFPQTDVSRAVAMIGTALQSDSIMLAPKLPYVPQTSAYPYHMGDCLTHAEWNMMFEGSTMMTSELGHVEKYSRSMGAPWFIYKNHGIGAPLSTSDGRVPSIGTCLTCGGGGWSGNPNAMFYPYHGRRITGRALLAKLGPWDMRPFLSTCLPRLYFQEAGPADQTIGLDLQPSEVLSVADQVMVESHERNVNESYTGTKELSDCRYYVDVVPVIAEAWPHDVVAANTRYWSSVYDLAEQLARD